MPNSSSLTARRLKANRDAGKGSLVGYFPAGYPSVQGAIDAAITMCQNGVDVLEVGVPYSDPVMDGPVIQEATQAALDAGFRLKDVFATVKAITEAVDTPVLVMHLCADAAVPPPISRLGATAPRLRRQPYLRVRRKASKKSSDCRRSAMLCWATSAATSAPTGSKGWPVDMASTWAWHARSR